MRKAIVLIALAFLAVCAVPVHANGIPPLPHAFYGNVTINHSPAPAGTKIEARGKGVLTGIDGNPITTTELGKYGKAGALEPKLIVQGDIQDGARIDFLVNGAYTGTTFAFKSGETTVLDLNLVITATTVTARVEETIAPGQTGYQVGLPEANTTVTVDTTGVVTVTVEKYVSNPHPEVSPPASMLPRYIDIKVSDAAAIRWPMHVEQTYTDAEVAGLVESSLGMYYFKAGAWNRCSDTGVNTQANILWANMLATELSGSPVAMGGTAAAAPGGGGGGGGGGFTVTGLVPTPPLVLDFWGRTQVTCRLKSTDGRLTLDIATGTVLRDSSGAALTSLVAALESSPPAPPPGAVIISAYKLEPNGATFSPAVTLTIDYDPASLPKDVAEKDLYIAYWDGSKWLALKSTVDTTAHRVSCGLDHFTTFAVIAPPAPPAPAAFKVSGLSIQPAQVKPKETVTITLSVANTGGMQGSYNVVLMINGVKEAEKSITIPAGSSQSVSFSVTKEQAGSYSVTVDGLTGNFTIAAPAPPPPPAPPEAKTPISWMMVGIIAGVVILVALVISLVRRRG